MKNSNLYLHQLWASLLLLVVLIPFAIQASQALDSHEHVVCTAKDVKHFHEQDIDCCLCHTPVELHTLLFNFSNDSFEPLEYHNSSKAIVQLTSLELSSHKSSRAPPFLF